MNKNENITLVENNNIILSEIEIAEKLNAFFSNIVKELNIKVKEDLLCDVSDINDPVERAIQKYKNHPSIQMIKETFDSSKTFSFDTIFKEIVSLDTKKATHSNDVRPVSLLPNISKIFERCMHRQISEYFETVLSKFQCGFRKGYSTQDCLLAMVENCKKALDQGNEYGALLTDLSKAFDRLPHDF